MLRWLAALALLLLPAAVLAQSSAQLEHTRVELVAESARPAPGGKVTLGVVMTPKPKWHTYWLNPGDAGAPTRAAWTLPPGTAAGELRYPTPETFIVAGLMNYVYAHENVLLADLTLPAGVAPGTPLPVVVKLDWLVCDDQLCVPESATLRLDLAAGDGAADPAQAERFAAARAALPKPVDWPARFAFNGDRFVLGVPFAQATKVRGGYFFPAVEGALGYAAPQAIGLAGDTVRIETAAESARDLKAVPGILKLEVEGYDQPLAFAITATPGPVPASATPIAAQSGAGGDNGLRTAGFALLAAIAGGLLLNVMPCVFPILSLKALSLARGGASEADARREAVAYTLGVVLTCLALGGLILALRAAGANVGWAFQLQDPRVIALLFLLMVAIGLNLAGLYEIDVAGRGTGSRLASKGGASGAFWTGALAAFVATPCTGPFMGVALGAAIALPPAAGLAVFAGLGLGLALPFLLLGFVPALRRRLPKPGAWMDRFRRLLAVPMFLTALALAWVLGRQAGVEGMTLGLGAALLLALALWWLGRRQTDGRRPALAPIGLAAASLLAVLLVSPAVESRAEPAGDAVLAAEPFSPERLAALTAARKPAFVYFTADWCITCKVNERGALGSDAVAQAFERAGVTTLVGDWTQPDPVIARFLESRGRNGIPLYLFYRADGSVEELPQILTVDRLTGLVA